MSRKRMFFILTVILSFYTFSSIADSTHTVIGSFIDKDKTLDKGVYIIENNVKVSKEATLTVKSGSKLLFRKGATLKVDGGLLLEGTPNNFIEITSENKEVEGFGIIVSGINKDKEINIQYCKFSYLLIPINFEKNWVRKNVNIENNVFENLITGESSIIIRRPDEITSRDTIRFSFSKNNFTKNNSSIFIEDIESDILNLQFNYNLITQNYFLGFEVGGRLNAPLSTCFNQKGQKFSTDFLGNSIFNNYLLHSSNDTVIQEVNFGILGRAEKCSLDSNFFGVRSSIEIQKTFDHFSNNQSSPYLVINENLLAPLDSVHGHIWRIKVNNNDLKEKNKLPLITDQKLELQVYYNRPLIVRDGINYISYTYFDEAANELKSKNLSYSLKLDKVNKSIHFIINDDVYIKNKNGYFSVIGLTDNEGFTVPKVYAGKEIFKIFLINNNIKGILE